MCGKSYMEKLSFCRSNVYVPAKMADLQEVYSSSNSTLQQQPSPPARVEGGARTKWSRPRAPPCSFGASDTNRLRYLNRRQQNERVRQSRSQPDGRSSGRAPRCRFCRRRCCRCFLQTRFFKDSCNPLRRRLVGNPVKCAPSPHNRLTIPQDEFPCNPSRLSGMEKPGPAQVKVGASS